MNEVFAATTALVITLGIWAIGKKEAPPSIKGNKSHFISNLNSTNTALVEKKNIDGNLSFLGKSPSKMPWEAPSTQRERINLYKKLGQLICGSPEERLHAVSVSGLWGHSSILPILRRGLKDSDSRVVCAAAAAIERHKVASSGKNSHETGRPPRNVFLMR